MKLTLSIFILTMFTKAFSADLKSLDKLFQKNFYSSIYEENRCAKNIDTFVQLANSKDINLDNTFIVEITNNGISDFGLVAAVNARESGPFIIPRPSAPPFNQSGSRNWNYHVVLIADNNVFDFDFTNGPVILKTEDYFLNQFITNKRRSDSEFIHSKIGNYKLTFYPALKYLEFKKERKSTQSIKKEIHYFELFQ